MAEQSLFSQHAYAKRRGVSRQYIGKLVREGVLPLTNGKIDPDQADSILEARREPARPSKNDDADVGGASLPVPNGKRGVASADLPTLLLKTRIKRETERAKLLEIKARVEAGKYVDADEVRAAAFSKARSVRDRLQAIPDRIDAVIAAETDRRKVHELLSEEIAKALEDLSSK